MPEWESIAVKRKGARRLYLSDSRINSPGHPVRLCSRFSKAPKFPLLHTDASPIERHLTIPVFGIRAFFMFHRNRGYPQRGAPR